MNVESRKMGAGSSIRQWASKLAISLAYRVSWIMRGVDNNRLEKRRRYVG